MVISSFSHVMSTAPKCPGSKMVTPRRTCPSLPSSCPNYSPNGRPCNQDSPCTYKVKVVGASRDHFPNRVDDRVFIAADASHEMRPGKRMPSNLASGRHGTSSKMPAHRVAATRIAFEFPRSSGRSRSRILPSRNQSLPPLRPFRKGCRSSSSPRSPNGFCCRFQGCSVTPDDLS
jgi:hypothetical protein